MRETGGSEGPWCLSGLHFSMASVSEEGWELGREGFVGVFDSGVGGISVLRALTAELPHEDFHFFGDSANAPYGEKSVEEVRALVAHIADGMLADGAKAIVIACCARSIPTCPSSAWSRPSSLRSRLRGRAPSS